jgi:hypothetical protein
MKIIFGVSSFDVERHAAAVIRQINNEKHNNFDPKPRGVAHTLAVMPVLCDDCGCTFWARDPYASHIGCRGFRKGAGFSNG